MYVKGMSSLVLENGIFLFKKHEIIFEVRACHKKTHFNFVMYLAW